MWIQIQGLLTRRQWLILGSFVSVSGSWFNLMAMQWLLEEPTLVTLNGALGAVTVILVGILISGRAEDRDALEHAKIANLLLAFLMGLIGLLVWHGVTKPSVLIAVSLLANVIYVIRDPAESTLFKYAGEKVRGFRDLCQKMSGRFVGRALVGLTIALLAIRLGIAPLFWFDAATFLFMLFIISSIRLDLPESVSNSPRATFRDQMRYAASHHGFLKLMAVVTVQNGIGWIIFSLLPKLSGNVTTYGTLMTFAGFGSVLCAFLTVVVLYRRPEFSFRLFAICSVFGTVPLLATLLGDSERAALLPWAYFLGNVVGTLPLLLSEYRCLRDPQAALTFRVQYLFYSGVSHLLRLSIASFVVPRLGVERTVGTCALASSVICLILLIWWRKDISRELAMPEDF